MKKKKEYQLLVRLEPEVGTDIKDISQKNDRSINSEVKVAIKNHIKKEKSK